jgi:acetyl-CoA decarbonylase/synthase complex subunit gamma
MLEDTMDEAGFEKAVKEIKDLKFERVGQLIAADLVCAKCVSGDKGRFEAFVKRVLELTHLNIALYCEDAAVCEGALKASRPRRPIAIAPSAGGIEGFVRIARENNVPLGVTANGLEEAVGLVEIAKKGGIEEIVLNLAADTISGRIQHFTFARRSALKKNYRPLGYPVMAIAGSSRPDLEMAEAISYIDKYAGIVIVKHFAKEYIFPLLVARQDIYQDPQKPVQVEPKIYEIGRVTRESPVLVTTNFSITYFTVAGEVESSKVPSYIISCDSEGMSVLTAWAAEKFTAEKISETLKTSGIIDRVSHRRVVIPGYVSVLSGKLEEESGWKVSVGPKEASGITNFLRNYR